MRGYFNTPYQDDASFTNPPAQVINLTALVISGSEIDLNWNDAAGASGYNIYRNSAVIGFSAPSFLKDTGVSPGTTYTYKVAATNIHGQGPFSNNVTVTTAPAQVTGLTANTRSTSQIDLIWNSVVGATSYSITRNGPVVHTGVVGTAYSDTGLNPATSYTYTVSAVGIGGTGLASASATAITNSAGAAQIRTFSGHWIYIDQGVSKDSQFARTQQLVGIMGADVVGYEYLWKWADLENPNVPGDYSGNWAAAGQAGFQLVHRFADYLRSVGKKMHMNNFSYGGNIGSGGPGSAGTSFLSSEMPAFFAGSAYGRNSVTVDGIFGGLWMNSFNQGPNPWSFVKSFMRFWEPAVGARMLALSQAYATEFNSHTGFGMFSPFSESALPFQMATYNITVDKAFWMGPSGAFAQMRAHWPNVPLRWWGNFTGLRSDMSIYLNAVVANKWLSAGPDLLNDFTDLNTTNYPAWSSSPNYVFSNTVSRSGQNYFCLTANTNSLPALDPNTGLSTNSNWEALGMGTRSIDSDFVWQGRDANNVVNSAYTNWVGQGAFGHDVEPLDLDRSHDDAVGTTHITHANKVGSFALFWYDLRFNSSNKTPDRNRTDRPSPNLLDQISSSARGGVNVNGFNIGRLLLDKSYPPTW